MRTKAELVLEVGPIRKEMQKIMNWLTVLGDSVLYFCSRC